MADDHDQLQSRLVEIPSPQASPVASVATLDPLAKKFSHLSISDLTRTRKATESQDSHLNTSNLSKLETPSDVLIEEPSCFPLGLKNLTSVFQESIQPLLQSEHEIPLIGA